MNFLNVVVSNEYVQEYDRNTLFPDNEDVLVLWPGHKKDIYDLLIIIGAFPSKSQARKNWKGPSYIPTGWNEFWVAKAKRHLCIWNPSE